MASTNKSIHISKDAWDIAERLNKDLNLWLITWARIALWVSLNINGNKAPETLDSWWKEFNKYSLIKSEIEWFYRTLLESLYWRPLTEDEYFSENSYLKNHIDAWFRILWKMYEECEYNIDLFKIKLLSFANDVNKKANISKLTTRSTWNVHPLILNVWKDSDWNDYIIELNNKEKHGNSHLAIMWKPWVWKTQILLNILCQIREQSKYETNFIFFDYKWEDSLYRDPFMKHAKSNYFIASEDLIPINPFILNNYDEQTINISAKAKADSFSAAAWRWFGDVQINNLQDIIIECYNNRKWKEKPYPDLKEVYETALEFYDSKGKKADSVISLLRWLASFGLFANNDDVDEYMETIYDKSFIIWLNKIQAEWLKELVAYLIIEKLYTEMHALPESKIVDWYRQIRTILVIDEAHNYLWQKNPFLIKLVKEWRSKWIVVFFASQSPKDYEQDEYNFKEDLEFSLVLWCNELTSSSIERLIWCTSWVAQDLKSKIPQFEPFKVLMKSKDSKLWYKVFDWEPFYKRFK